MIYTILQQYRPIFSELFIKSMNFLIFNRTNLNIIYILNNDDHQ